MTKKENSKSLCAFFQFKKAHNLKPDIMDGIPTLMIRMRNYKGWIITNQYIYTGAYAWKPPQTINTSNAI